MGLTSFGEIALNNWNGSDPIQVTEPSVSRSTWIHVVGAYSSTNGEQLYVNGSLMASSSAFSFTSSGVSMTITFGNSLSGTGTIQKGQFYSSLDEFYVYARELNATEVAALANV